MDLRIAQTIKKQRKSRDMTQEELARALGVSPQSVSKWECGDGYPDITLLPGIANFFAITVDELIGNDALGREEDFKIYGDQLGKLTGHDAVRLIQDHLRKYPDDHFETTNLATEIMALPLEERAQYLPFLKERADKLMKECTEQWWRERMIRKMAILSPEEDVDEWMDLCASSYDEAVNEVQEDRLWCHGKHEESRLRFDLNNLNILLHFMQRENRNWAAPERATAWFENNIRLIEFFGEDGEIPQAWWGKYADLHFRAGCSSFGYGDKEKGYAYLERAFELYPRWLEIPCGTPLPLGRKILFNDIKGIKNTWKVLLPDGSRHFFSGGGYGIFLRHYSEAMYYAMTAPRGWEWFNDVRDEDRFKEYVERARMLMEKYPEPVEDDEE